MRKLTRFLVFAAVVALATMSTSVNAQDSDFGSYEACDAALKSGNFSIYVPVDVSRKNVNPIDGIRVFGVKLEADQCRFQKTMKGMRWVVQKGDTRMRARRDASGELVVFARDDCGNEDKTPDPAPAPTPVTATPPPPTQEPAKKLELPQNVYNSFYVNQSTEVHQQQILQPLLTNDQDRFHGWCGFWSHAGCTAIAVVVVGGTVYVATRDKGDDGVSPDADTGGSFLRAGITPRVGFIPPSHGRGGGAFIGARIGW